MSTYLNILFTLFLLFPGFLALRICNSTKEYRDLSTFEFTSISLGFSLIIMLLWLLENYILKSYLISNYSFFNNLKNLIISEDPEVLFSPFSGFFLITYINAFTIFSLLAYNCSWIGIYSKFKKAIGLIRFSPHLTPWEDFQILSKYNWLAVELKDGRTIFGKIGVGSHMPFDKEIVLKRLDNSSIIIYNKDNKKVDFGPEIDLSYVNYSEIVNIHSIKDSGVQITPPSIKDYVFVLITLLLSVLLISLFSTSLIYNLSDSLKCPLVTEIILFLISLLAVILNFKTLSRFN